jgi:hypothetical protein
MEITSACRICRDPEKAATVEREMLAGNGIRGASKASGVSINPTLAHVRFHVSESMRARFRAASAAAASRKLRGNQYARRSKKAEPVSSTNSGRLHRDADFDADTYGPTSVKREAEALVAMCGDRGDVPAIRATILVTPAEERCLTKNGVPSARCKSFREKVARTFDMLAESDFERIQARANRIRSHIRKREAIEQRIHAAREKLKRRQVAEADEREEAYA